ncbi:hypothetical protein C8F01DRAFT_1268701 [Mycena amicta]|nr:hypothetical protein C8F01DRAFT_1268701 [Mycena amicta]
MSRSNSPARDAPPNSTRDSPHPHSPLSHPPSPPNLPGPEGSVGPQLPAPSSPSAVRPDDATPPPVLPPEGTPPPASPRDLDADIVPDNLLDDDDDLLLDSDSDLENGSDGKEEDEPESEDEDEWGVAEDLGDSSVGFSGVIPGRNRPKQQKPSGYRAEQKSRQQTNMDMDEDILRYRLKVQEKEEKFKLRLAKKYDKKKVEWKKSRAVSLRNAKVSHYMAGVNKKHLANNKKPITLPRAQKRIKKKPELLDVSPEKEEELRQAILAQRDVKAKGKWGTALAEGHDYLATVKEAVQELINLSARSNVAALLVVSPTQPGAVGNAMAVGINGGAEFASLKLNKSEVLLAHQLRVFVENLAPGSIQSRIRGMKAEEVNEQARELVVSGLAQAVGRSIRMFYSPAYFKIVQEHRVFLDGWVGPWGSPKELRNRAQAEQLLKALQTGACAWRPIKGAEHEEKVKKDWEEMTGMTAECAPRKKRADAGSTHQTKKPKARRDKDESGSESEPEETVTTRREKRVVPAKRRSKSVVEDDEDDSEDEDEDEEPTPTDKKATKRKAGRSGSDNDSDGEPATKKAAKSKSVSRTTDKATKRKAGPGGSDNDSDREPVAKKVTKCKTSKDGDEPTQPAKGKGKRSREQGEGGGQCKKQKRVEEGSVKSKATTTKKNVVKGRMGKPPGRRE